MKWEVVMDGN